MGGKVSQEVRERYNSKTYDRCYFRLRKDDELTLAVIRQQADNNNMSLNAYIVEALREKIERDNN